jgi:hypothetical protein
MKHMKTSVNKYKKIFFSFKKYTCNNIIPVHKGL